MYKIPIYLPSIPVYLTFLPIRYVRVYIVLYTNGEVSTSIEAARVCMCDGRRKHEFH